MILSGVYYSSLFLLAGCLAFDLDFYPELSVQSQGSRHRRETHNKPADELKECQESGMWWKRRCCGDGGVYNQEFVDDKGLKIKACQEEIRSRNITKVVVDPFLEKYSCEKAQESRRTADCSVECVYKKYGIIDGDGNVSIDKLKDAYNWFIKADWRKQLANRAAEKCTQLKDLDGSTSQTACSPKAFNLKHCLWREIVVSCPEEHQLKSEFCDRARNYFNQKGKQ